jgi:hypothetical protein
MRFGSRRRVETMRAVAEVAAGVEARLRVQLVALERTQSTTNEVLEATRADLERRESDLVRAWELVAEACERTVECVNADRAERHELMASLRELVASPNDSHSARVVETPAATRVLGGAVYAELVDIDLTDDEEVDGDRNGDRGEVVDVLRPRDAPVQVWSLFDDDWVGGFEICGVVERDGAVQYRLRRRSDQSVLPKLFDATDVRPVDRLLQGQQLGLWSRA